MDRPVANGGSRQERYPASSPARRRHLRVVHRLVLGGQDDLQQLAVVRPSDDRVADARRLHPTGSGNQALPPHAFELGLEPAPEAVHHLELHVVMVPDADFGPEWSDHADHVCMCQASCRTRHAEVAVSRVVTQTAGLEGGLVGMADDEALRKCHASLR